MNPPLRWTRKKPTVPGEYWTRVGKQGGGDRIHTVIRDDAGEMRCFPSSAYRAELLGDLPYTFWAGPIPKPEEDTSDHVVATLEKP